MRLRIGAAATLALLLGAEAAAAKAGCRMDVAGFVGSQIIYAGKVTGWREGKGPSLKGDEPFEGCEPGRRLLVDEDRQLTCIGRKPGYGWRPDVVVLSNGEQMVACIANALFRVRN